MHISSFIYFYLCALIIFNQNNFPSHLQWHLFSDDAGVRSGQPVTQEIATNSKTQPPNQTINSIGKNQAPLYLFLDFLFEKPFHLDICHIRKDKTIATSVSCRL